MANLQRVLALLDTDAMRRCGVSNSAFLDVAFCELRPAPAKEIRSIFRRNLKLQPVICGNIRELDPSRDATNMLGLSEESPSTPSSER